MLRGCPQNDGRRCRNPPTAGGGVDNHQVDLVEPHTFERDVDGLGRLVVGLDASLELGSHEDLVTRDAAAADALADAAFVAVGLCGVDVAVAKFDGLADGFGDVVVDHPGAEPQFGNRDAFGQGVGFVEDHGLSPSFGGRRPARGPYRSARCWW